MKVIGKKDISYYLTAIGIFILLKIGYTNADNNSLAFLLKPTDKILGFVTNSGSQFILESGYYHEKLNIIIDKSCSGFNFWILCFLMLAFSMVKFIEKKTFGILALPAILIISYFITIFVNTSRILFSISTHNIAIKVFNNQLVWLHQAEGAFIYLSFLILIYLSFDFLLKNFKQKHEKLI